MMSEVSLNASERNTCLHTVSELYRFIKCNHNFSSVRSTKSIHETF